MILRLLFFAFGKAQRIVIFHLGLWRKVRVGCLFAKRCSINHVFLNQIQVPVPARAWRFESSFRHHRLQPFPRSSASKELVKIPFTSHSVFMHTTVRIGTVHQLAHPDDITRGDTLRGIDFDSFITLSWIDNVSMAQPSPLSTATA